MRNKRDNPQVIVVKHVWPGLLFAMIWLQFSHTQQYLTVNIGWVYALLAFISLVMAYRTRIALKRPNSPIQKYIPFVDAIVLAFAIRFTGGMHSELWLFYYFQLVVGAMDPDPRTMEVLLPLVIVSYIGSSFPEVRHLNWEVMEILGTRLFFLFLTAMLIRQMAQARNRLSDEIGRLSEQLSLSQERNRISREIHDGIGHSLVNCILTLELCGRLVCSKPEEAVKIIEQEKADLRSALDDMRDYVHHLRPAEIENEEFVPLVKRYLARFGERTGLKTRLDCKNEMVDLPPSSRLVLLRILQEALTNAAKHSDATEVNVALSCTPSSGVCCMIRDNGCGFNEEEIMNDLASRQGFGLRTILDRASSVGGEAEVHSAPGEGTQVSVTIPG